MRDGDASAHCSFGERRHKQTWGQKQIWGQIQILRGKIRADMGDKGKHGGQEQILKGKIKSRHEGADLDLERQVILPMSMSIHILTNYLIIRSLCKVIRESV